MFSFVILLMIVASCACFVLETHEYFQARPDLMRKMALCEVVCIVTFTVEYIVRLCCCNYRPSPNAVGAMGVLRYVFKPMNLIDLLAIAPFWMEQLLHTHAKTEVVRMARMTRIFRIFKTSAYATELTLFVEGMRRAREGLMILTFMLGLYLCVFGTLLYMAEHDSQQLCKMPEVAQFSYKGSSCPAVVGFTSIPTGWYFILATLTTVGYGDMYPITITGKMLTGFCMACGIMVLGLPIVVISNSFDDAFKDAARNAALREAKAEDKKFQARVQKNAIDVTGKVGGVRVSRARVGSKNQSAAEYFNLGSGDPSIDVLITIRSLMLILDDLYMHSGDQRFDSARRALTRGLDKDVHKDFATLDLSHIHEHAVHAR